MADGRPLQEQFGSRIRKLRKAREWTQSALAERSGLDAKFVGGIERGERNITLDTVEKLAVGFQIEAAHLFLFSEPSVPKALTDAKIRDLLANTDPARKEMMEQLLSIVAAYGE